MKDKNATEMLMGFIAYVTTRKEKVSVGSSCDCVPITELANTFILANDMPDVTEDYPDTFVMPDE